MSVTQVISWLRALAWVFIIGLGAWVLTCIYRTLMLFFVAAAMSYLLYPWVRWLHERSLAFLGGRKLSWTSAVILAYLTLPGVFGGAVLVTVPAVTSQVETLQRQLPEQYDRLRVAVLYWQGRLDQAHLPPTLQQQVNNLVANAVNRMGETLANFFGQIGNMLLYSMLLVLYLIVALIVSNFMLLYLPEMKARFYDAIPQGYRDEVGQVLHEIHFMLGGFIKGTFCLSLSAGIGVFVALTALSRLAPAIPGFVPFDYSLIVGLLTMLAYPIPILGLAVLTLMVLMMAWFQGGSAAYVFTVASTVVVVFNAVDRVVGPRVMSKAMGVSPLFIMFAAFAGAEFMGFWGMLLGVPVAAALKILFRYVRSRFLVPQEGEPMAALVEAAEGALGSVPEVVPRVASVVGGGTQAGKTVAGKEHVADRGTR